MKKNDTKRVENFLESIDWLFNLNNFDRTIILPKENEVFDSGTATAKIEYDIDYQTVDITLFPFFFERSLEDQRKTLLHELCHSLSFDSKRAINDLIDGKLVTKKRMIEIDEKMTSKIENILNGLLDGRLMYAKKAYADYLQPQKKKSKIEKKKT